MADIKVKLGVDGEASFKQAISDSTSKVKEMKSELALAQSEYDKTGNKAQYLKDKSDALKDAIQAQNEKIEALKGALDNAKEKFGDNSAKVYDWQTKLNNAKAELNDMQTELESTTKAMEGIGTAAEGSMENTDALDESIDGINEEGKLDNLLEGLQKVGEFAGNAAKKAWEIGTALWGGTVEASDWADEILTLGTQYNLDTSTLQGWRYASNLIDTEVDTILSARQKMIKNMAYPNDDVAALWQALGIDPTDGEGGLRDANDVFWEAIEALGRIENETDRDAAAMLLFGKRAAELNPLIEAGRDAWEATVNEAGELGVILDDTDVQKLGEFNDELQKMNAVVESMKLKFFAALAPGMTIIAEALKTASVQLSAFLESAEGKAAVEQLGKTIAKFVTTLVDKLPELLPLLTKLAETATQLLSFIADHAGELMGVLGTLFVGGKTSQFMSWLNGIPFLKGLFGGGGGTAAAGGGGAVAGGTAMNLTAMGNTAAAMAPAGVFLVGTLPAVLAQAADNKAMAAKLAELSAEAEAAAARAGEAGAAAKAAADTAIEGLGISGKTVYGQDIYSDPAKVSEALNTIAGMDDLSFLSGETQLMMEQYKQGMLSGQDTNALLWRVAEDAIQHMNSPGGGGDGTDIGDTLDSLIELKDALAEDPTGNEGGLYAAIHSLAEDSDVLGALTDETKELLGAWLNPERGFGNGGPSLFSDSLDLLDRVMADLEAATEEAGAAGAAVGEAAVEGAEGASDNSGAGNNAGKTFVDAIFSWNPSAWAAGFGLGESAANGLGAALDIHSPSRVMREMGGFVAEGFAEGIEGGIGMVEDAVYAMSDATVGTAMHHQDGRPGGNMAEMLVNALNGVTVSIDGQVAGRLIAPTVSAVMGDEADAWRYEAE